mgnify:CR=1 FL=1
MTAHLVSSIDTKDFGAETVRIATAGDYDVGLAKLNLAERQVPIRVKLPDTVRADLDALDRTYPGARFIMTHRDPAKVLADLGSSLDGLEDAEAAARLRARVDVRRQLEAALASAD